MARKVSKSQHNWERRGILVRDVYQGYRQFDDVADLKEALFLAWDNISLNMIRNIVKSMPRRCGEVTVKRGGLTWY